MSGCFSRISFAARSPSSVCVGGILMSTIAMSGLYERTFSSRSSAVPLCPTISNPLSVEQAGDALAQEHRVVGEDDADRRLRLARGSGCSTSTLRSVAEIRARYGRRAGSARPSEQRVDRLGRELGLRNEAERGAARPRAPRNRLPSRLEVRITSSGKSSSESRSATSNPSMSGNCTSTMTRSGSCSRAS